MTNDRFLIGTVVTMILGAFLMMGAFLAWNASHPCTETGNVTHVSQVSGKEWTRVECIAR